MNGRCPEQLLQCGIVAFHSQHYRSSSVVIPALRIGSGTKQQFDDRGLSGQAVCTGLTGRFPETSDRLVKRRKSKLVTDGCLRACVQKRFDAGQMTLKAGFVQGGVSIPVSCLHLRALIEEQQDERRVAACRRGNQRRGPFGIAGFDIGSAVEQNLGPGRRALGQCCMDRVF